MNTTSQDLLTIITVHALRGEYGSTQFVTTREVNLQEINKYFYPHVSATPFHKLQDLVDFMSHIDENDRRELKLIRKAAARDFAITDVTGGISSYAHYSEQTTYISIYANGMMIL